MTFVGWFDHFLSNFIHAVFTWTGDGFRLTSPPLFHELLNARLAYTVILGLWVMDDDRGCRLFRDQLECRGKRNAEL